MLDGKPWHALQRSMGEADLAIDASGASGMRIRRLRQKGCAKAFLPKGAAHEAVFLNTSGGLTGGDQLAFSLELSADVDFMATTQTAERAYASAGGAASVRINLRAGARSRLTWLPQETILYENAQLNRVTDVSLDQGATALACEMTVLGRHAMQENPRSLVFEDLRRFYIGGRLVWSELIRLGPEQLSRQNGRAILDGARCFATLVMVGHGVEDAAPALAPLLDAADCETAISAWNGKLILRARARHSWPMRCQIARILTQLRGKPLPRVWQMNGDIL